MEQVTPKIFKNLESEIPNPKQIEFFEADSKHIAYGGARGGGKSWAMRRKFVMLAMRYDGLRLLLLRRTLPELRNNHIIPLREELEGYAKYNETEKTFTFPNKSMIFLGYCDAEADALRYQGQEYDVIGMEEATNFTEQQRNWIITSSRSTREDFKPRVYYTCNPGGVGHAWVKRLFVDRQYRPEEDPNDYKFIQAQVFDNKILMERNPEYLKILESLPEDMKRAHLYGDWDVFSGQYFSEFRYDLHVMKPFEIPSDWVRYVALDYGLDMLACYWIAVDRQGFEYVYKELYQPGLIISDAAMKIRDWTTETVSQYIAPPDLWNRRQDTGRSAAEIFGEYGIYLQKANNDRVQGWYDLHEHLKECRDELGERASKLRIFSNCTNLIRTLPLLQFDSKNPNDVANEPHEITHAPDAIRYFVSSRPMETPMPSIRKAKWEEDMYEDYYNATPEEQDLLLLKWGDPF